MLLTYPRVATASRRRLAAGRADRANYILATEHLSGFPRLEDKKQNY